MSKFQDPRQPRKTHQYIVLADLRRAIAENQHLIRGRILDFGCGRRPHADLFQHAEVYEGADFPTYPAEIRINEDGTLPVDSGIYDAVVSFQVLEHVENVHLYLSECRRVLRPGGVLMLSTHGIWPYHAYPLDLRRWTHDGLRRELAENGFTDIQITPVTWGIRAWLQITLLFLHLWFQTKPRRLEKGVCLAVNWLADRFAWREVTDSTWYQMPLVYLCLGFLRQD